ncbi:hypothetical protein AB0K60_16610 [Thermopolyspora sp. NPDC052614]|uniref:hypothetical protein n=1 Tax=Thermopolyspora sp. NPDC052614 TaxID=3155682 RepID=UPI00342AE115
MATDPLLDALDTLLDAPRSELGRFTRNALARLTANLSLRIYRYGGEDESVLRAAKVLRDELDARLLRARPGTPPSDSDTPPAPDQAETPVPDLTETSAPDEAEAPAPDQAEVPAWLAELTGRLLDDKASARWLDEGPTAPGDPAWAAAALLRLPAEEAERRREEVKRLAPESADELRAPEGIRDDVAQALGPEALDHYRNVALVISDVLNAVELDRNLCTSALPGPSARSLADEQARKEYHDKVVGWLKSLAASKDAADTIDWLVRVDEAVRSVFPRPLPAPTSWWRQLGDRSFDALHRYVKRAAPEAEVGLVQEGPYGEGEAGRRAPKEERNIGIDEGSARRGQILWCLRAWYEYANPAGPPRIRGARVLYGR